MIPKVCPFHTEQVEIEVVEFSYGYRVCCELCGTYGPFSVDRDIALEMWNTRAGSEYQAEIDALKAELAALRGDK